MIEPANKILAYIEGQSEMIQPALFVAVVSPYMSLESWRQLQDAPALARNALNTGPEISLFYRCISAIGSLDYFFSGVGAPDFWESVPIEMLEGDARLKLIAMQAPLARRQRELAQASWTKLREGDLSFQALRAFQASHTEAWTEIVIGG